MRRPYSFLIGLLVLLLTFSTANAEKRVALVIGNGAYKNAPKLPNPPSDASDVAASLAQSGLDIISRPTLIKLGCRRHRYALHVRRAPQTLHCFTIAVTPCSLPV
jgi:hypothetical protein